MNRRSKDDHDTLAREAPRDPVVRRMNFDFEPDGRELPRHWLYRSAVATALVNGLNLLFPAGERFFVRSVNHYLPQIEDPRLRDRVKRFFGQEGQHAHEHQRFFEIMRRQGYDIDAFLGPYQRLGYGWLEPRVHPKMRLAITVALEHYTATLAELVLSTRFIEEVAPEEMVALLLWHATEEIEHKDVAFDVLQEIDDGYALRIAGAVAASLLLTGFWAMATVILLQQEPRLNWKTLAGDFFQARDGRVDGKLLLRSFFAYLAPGFHPADTGNDELAWAYMREAGLATE